jgi:hypothetical protein
MKTPKAFRHSAQSCAQRYPGSPVPKYIQPQRGCIPCSPIRFNPVGVDGYFDSRSQGSRCAPTLGWMPLPRWGNAARTPPEKTSLERQVAAADTQIDRLVYDLYGLTEAEIKIVEGEGEAPPPPLPLSPILCGLLSGLFHKYGHVRGNGFWAEARRERRAYPKVDL